MSSLPRLDPRGQRFRPAGMAWIILILAGLLEVVWAVALKYSHGFTRLWPTLIAAVNVVLSLALLSWAARSLPLGTAYAVWVGIGALGAAIVGIIAFGEPMTPPRLLFLGLLLVAIIGLKVTSTS